MPLDDDSAAEPTLARATRQWLGLILLAGLGIRTYLILTTVLVSRDTVTFIQFAKGLAEDPLRVIRANDQHPLYPILILGFHRFRCLFGAVDSPESWAVSAQWVSCFGGLACVGAMYLLARRVFDRRVGLLAALFMACLPEACQYSGDGLSDMVHLFFYLFGLWAALRGFQDGNLSALILAGLVSGLAFLTRPEGLIVAAVTIAVLLREPIGWRAGRRALAAVSVVLAFAVWAGPYALITGKAVQKKSLPRLIGVEARAVGEPAGIDAAFGPAPGASEVGGTSDLVLAGDVRFWLRTIPELIEDCGRALRVTYLGLFIVGLLRITGRRARSPAGWLLAGAGGLHLLAVVRVAETYGYFSLRHFLIPAALCLPHAAAGAAFLIELLGKHVPALRRRGPATAAVLIATIVPTLPWALPRLGANMGHYREAARYINEQYPEDTVVITTRFRIAYFARRPCQPWPDDGKVEDLLAHLGAPREIVLLEEARVLRRNPRFFDELNQVAVQPGRMRLRHEIPAPPGDGATRLLLYDVLKKDPER